MKKTRINTEKHKTHIILFGGITDPGDGGGGGGGGGDGGGGGGGGDPFPGGDPGGGSGCAAYAINLVQGAAVTTTSISSSVTNIDATHRTILYTWAVYTGPLGIWRYVSRDLGTQIKISGAWQWVSISHLSVTLEGTTLGYTLTYTDLLPPSGVIVSPVSAYMELNFQVRLTFYCGGAPFELPITPSGGGIANKPFTAS